MFSMRRGRLCRRRGSLCRIDYKSQHAKLRSENYRRWACMVMITTQVGDQRRRIAMIDSRTLWGWLFTISPSKIAFELRDKEREEP